jgi:hypothetical protein
LRIKFTYVLILALTVLSCAKDPCLKDKGDQISKNGSLPEEAYTLYVRDNMDIEIYRDSVNHYEIEGGANLVDHIDVSADNGVITVKDNNRCDVIRNFDQDSKVKLYISDLAKIDYGGNRNISIMDTIKRSAFIFISDEGGGDIKMMLDVDDLKIESKGSFIDFNMIGEVENMDLFLDGSSWFRAEKLDIKVGKVDNRSTGDCIVKASEKLDCYIYDIGNISYDGGAEVFLHVDEGKGRLIKR